LPFEWYGGNPQTTAVTTPVASGMSRKKKQRIDYPNIPSAIRPVPHREDLPVPEPPKYLHFEFGDGRGRHGENRTSRRRIYRFRLQGPASESPHKLTQKELNDLVRDFELPKVKANC